jgi:hypothetical protein
MSFVVLIDRRKLTDGLRTPGPHCVLKAQRIVWLAVAAQCLCLPIAVPGAGAADMTPGAPSLVCVAMPRNKSAQGAELAGPLRDGLVANLRASSVNAAALEAQQSEQIDAEARAKGCTQIIDSQYEQKHASGIGGMFRKLAPLAGALPMLGALGHGGGGATSALSAATQTAAAASGRAAEQQLTQGTAAAQQASSVKAGDTLTLEYRLTTPGNANAIKADKIVTKAQSDGQDVLTPAIAQIANTVASVSTRGSGGLAADSGPISTPRPISARASPGGTTMDCDHMSGAAGGIISADACRKLMASRQSYQQAASDPGASRPGDEQMSCADIAAELKNQQYTAPDRTKAAAARAATTKEQEMLARQQAEMHATAAAQQAAIDAAAVSDRATEAATAGLVDPHQASRLAEKFSDQNRATGERMAADRQPTEQKMMSSTADLGADAAQQLANNPRLARLIQLAGEKHCKRM